jgi:hypothetical protein
MESTRMAPKVRYIVEKEEAVGFSCNYRYLFGDDVAY